MMRTRILVIAALLLMLSASAAYAQKVETGLVGGHPVINCVGMPSSMYTTIAKGNTEDELKTKEANEKVYKRFAVHKIDNSSSSNWTDAFTVCSSVSGGVWRLPTQRELMLVWVLKRELERDTSSFTPFTADRYWSATEDTGSTSTSWNVTFYNGNTATYYKTYGSRVRCVREL